MVHDSSALFETGLFFRRSAARRKQVSQTENGIIPRSPNNGKFIFLYKSNAFMTSTNQNQPKADSRHLML